MFDAGAVKQSFGRAAAEYDNNASLQQQIRAHCITLGKRHWQDGAAILDAGCGTGALFKETSSLGWRITGLDASEGMCALAKKRGAVIHGDVIDMPFEENHFDGIISSLMLQWVNDPAQAFIEMSRVLKAGGQAVIATLVEGTLHELRESFAAIDGRPHVSAFLPTHTLLQHADAAGLSLVSARQVKLVEHYSDTISLMRALKVIGASNRDSNRRKGLMTPRQCATLERQYQRRFAGKQGIPASWQVLYLVMEKTCA